MNFNLDNLVRDNIKALKPYSSARSEFTGNASVFLDANENALAELYNRYPDPLQWQLKFALAKIKGVPAENIFLGNGSDEAIDILFRIFCEPKKDNVIVCPPTYGMYSVSATINDVTIKKVNLLSNFQLDVDNILKAINENTKLIFICSPNNPTGNSLDRNDILKLIQNFNGIVIIDEAYINFAKQASFIAELLNYPNLIVMQTLSKAWGLAGLRLGMCFASMDIIDLFNKVKPPYNINEATQQIALAALQNVDEVNSQIKIITQERDALFQKLQTFSFIKTVYKSDANFLLLKVDEATELYNYLIQNKIVVRNRTTEPLCENCIRITIGTPTENKLLLTALNNFTNA
jgi:histidinol-phosphate aminotransferase